MTRNAHLEIIVLAETELSNLDLHWIDDGKTAVPVLLWNDHGETALWGLRYNITGYRKRESDRWLTISILHVKLQAWLLHEPYVIPLTV